MGNGMNGVHEKPISVSMSSTTTIDSSVSASASLLRKGQKQTWLERLDAKFAGSKLDLHFRVTARGSNLSTELLAGLANFAANSYLLVLVPDLLDPVGIEQSQSLFGFVMSTFVSNMVMGPLANIPVALGPGVGCATYFANYFGKRMTAMNINPHDEATDPAVHLSVEQSVEYALGIGLLSGMLMFSLALFGVPQRLFDFCPSCIRSSMPSGLGMYLSLCGMIKLGMVVINSDTGLEMGNILAPHTLLGVIGVLMMVLMDHHHSRFKFVTPIVIVACVGWVFMDVPWPESVIGSIEISKAPNLATAFSSLSSASASPIMAMFLIALFDVAGIMYSCCGIAGVDGNERAVGGVSGAYWVFLAAGAGSAVSASMYCTPVIVLGESFAGVLAGGRTGITSISMAILFLITLPFHPILTAVPLFASSPTLIVLGSQLLALLPACALARTVDTVRPDGIVVSEPAPPLIDFDDVTEAFPAFCTIALMPFMFAIEKGIVAGLMAWVVLRLMDIVFQRELCKKEKNPGLSMSRSQSFAKYAHDSPMMLRRDVLKDKQHANESLVTVQVGV